MPQDFSYLTARIIDSLFNAHMHYNFFVGQMQNKYAINGGNIMLVSIFLVFKYIYAYRGKGVWLPIGVVRGVGFLRCSSNIAQAVVS